jgi:glycosyltransferase involved in cell wall biosynthesis
LIRESLPVCKLTLVTSYQNEAQKRALDTLRDELGIQVEAVQASTRRGGWRHLPRCGGARSIAGAFDPAFAELVRQVATQKRYDLIRFDTLSSTQYLECLPYPRPPCTVDEHNAEFMLWRRRSAQSRGLRTLTYRLESWLLQRYECCRLNAMAATSVVSEADAQVLKDAGVSCPLYVIPNGVDTAEKTPITASRQEKSRVLFLGPSAYEPNRDAVDWFLGNVWPSVLARCPHAQFRIAGKVDPSCTVRWEAHPHTQVLGFVNDLTTEIGQARVFVAPLRYGGGTKLKMLDALACGKAIVSTPVGAEGLELTPGEDFLLAHEAASFADAVIRVMDDDALALRLGRQARTRAVESFDWQVVGRHLRTMITELTHKPSDTTPATFNT